MSEYGVGVLANRFALVDLDEEDPFEVLERRQKEKEAKKKTDVVDKEKKPKEISGTVNGTVVAKKKPVLQKESPKNNKEDIRSKPEPRRSNDDSSEQMDDGFEQQRNGSFRSNRRGEGFQNGRPPMKGGKMSERVGNRGGGGGGRGNMGPGRGFQSRGGPGRPNDDDWNKTESALPEEEGNRRGNSRQQNQIDDDGFSRPDRRNRFAAGGTDNRPGNRGGRWRGGMRNRPGFEGKSGYQANNSNGRSRSGSEGEEKPEDVNNEWSATVSPEDSNKAVEEKNEKNESGNQNQGEENSSEEKTVEQSNQELTLDEWKAMKKRDGPTYNLRKAGEGEDLSKWKDMIKLDKKKNDGENESESEGEYEICDYPQRVGRQKYIKDLDFKFADRRRNPGPGNRSRNNRTGRPDPRGIPGKVDISESNVGYSPKQSVPKVDDERAFPSLG